MFGGFAKSEFRTKQKRACGFDTVTEEIPVAGPKGGMSKAGMQTIERKVPRYKTVKQRVPCTNCWRLYCPDKTCCGSTGPKTRRMASAQGHSGSPNIGLIPTMKPLKTWP